MAVMPAPVAVAFAMAILPSGAFVAGVVELSRLLVAASLCAAGLGTAVHLATRVVRAALARWRASWAR
jgi:hypothetical protein